MKRQINSGFNKEKLIFLGTAVLLAGSAYYFVTSSPVTLEPTAPVSSMQPPGPLDREKLDMRVADVRYYLESGIPSPVTKVAVNRERKNPFEPWDEFVPDLPKTAGGGSKTNQPSSQPSVPLPPPPPVPPVAIPEPKKPKQWDPNEEKKARVDFSGVMTMGNVTYGLLKSKDGTSIQVKEGDYIEEYNYTVSKIEKQAIWVADDDHQLFVARDTSFDAGSGGGGGAGGDEEGAKKEKPAKKPKTDKVAAAPAAKPQPQVQAQPQQPNRNQGNGNNNGGNKSNRGGGGGGNRGGRSGMGGGGF